jgi:hypothetical protein
MRRPPAAVVLALAGVSVAAEPPTAPAPHRSPEKWVRADSFAGTWVVRVDGEPAKVRPKAPWALTGWKNLSDRRIAFLIDGGKRMVYRQEDPANKGKKKTDTWRDRLVLADADDRNAKVLLTGLMHDRPFHPTLGGTAVVCAAETGDKWHLFRVTFDGQPPVRISQAGSSEYPPHHVLPDGRCLYLAVTGWHHEKALPPLNGTTSCVKGPAILADGKAEKVLVKEVICDLPAITDDGSTLARQVFAPNGLPLIEISDLNTGAVERVRMREFNPNWTCEFSNLAFRPDGKALALTFSFPVLFRENGPIPGDEALHHVGVIWLDGRRNRTTLVRVNHPDRKDFLDGVIRRIEWWGPPEGK